MSRLVARILLSIFVFPLGGLLYTVAFVVSEQWLRQGSGRYSYAVEVRAFLGTAMVTWAGIAVYWVLLWRTSVRWTAGRVSRTVVAAALAAAAGGAGGTAVAEAMGRGDGSTFGAFVGGVLAILLWLIATVVVWRETAEERARRAGGANANAVACPTCGYNLTGLSEARCPECGSRFTLDELVAGQPARLRDLE